MGESLHPPAPSRRGACLTSRVRIGGQVHGDRSKATPKKSSRQASVEPFAIAFVRSLDWTPALTSLFDQKEQGSNFFKIPLVAQFGDLRTLFKSGHKRVAHTKELKNMQRTYHSIAQLNYFSFCVC